jgi:competence protein ComEA
MRPALLREASSRVAARVVASRFAKPIARAAVVAAGLVLLAFIGSTAVAGAHGAIGAVGAGPPGAAPPSVAPPTVSLALSPAPASAPSSAPASAPTPTTLVATEGGPAARAPPAAGRPRATADDPVILNTATLDELRRLPRIGEKRAAAIVALRARLGGRFRTVEDLLKVKGIGRTTFRSLRPLVRLDPAPPPLEDAGPR